MCACKSLVVFLGCLYDIFNAVTHVRKQEIYKAKSEHIKLTFVFSRALIKRKVGMKK